MRPKVSNGMMHTHSKGVNALRKSDLSYEDLETKIESQETKIELLDSKLEYQDQYIEQLQHIIADLRRHRFG